MLLPPGGVGALQCKLTQHEGHPTEDLADTRSKVKDKLKDRLGTLTQGIQQIDHLVSAFEDRCTKLQQQKQTTEQDSGHVLTRYING
ncbi:uncharacterized protein LOC143276937 isoform X2 [Babylonia areolata]|uniref:uncharacterized protein LOC143276937 isoform X2 n=1 Tax=Babylonia areolata TaxID=304850 RepID=UPI003FD67E97